MVFGEGVRVVAIRWWFVDRFGFGRRVRGMGSGDLAEPAHCRAVIDRATAEFGGIDVLVSNAAFQMTHSDLTEISDEEWDYTFRPNVGPISIW